MKVLSWILCLFASTALAYSAPEKLEIEVTYLPPECDADAPKASSRNNVGVHYVSVESLLSPLLNDE